MPLIQRRLFTHVTSAVTINPIKQRSLSLVRLKAGEIMAMTSRNIITEKGRECSGECEEFKAWDKFYKSKTSRSANGYQSQCKDCMKKARGSTKKAGVLDVNLAASFLRAGFRRG